MKVTRSFKYRLRPSPSQIDTLVQWAGCSRWVWNWALQLKRDHYERTGKGLSYEELCLALTKQKRQPETQWLRECQAQVLQQTLKDLDKAFTNFFEKRTKYPRYKARKRSLPSIRFPQHVEVISKSLIRIPKIGHISSVIHRPLQGTVKSATIKQDSTTKWWVIFVCHIERPDVELTHNQPVGIDLGLQSFVTLHNGEKIIPPKFYRIGERKLRQLARKLSRSQKGSNNYQNAKHRLAKAHQRIANQRMDWLHKQALVIVKHFDIVCIEDLYIKGLVRTKLAKSFYDAALSSFVEMIEHKAQWYGRRVIKIGRFFASSKTCHRCQQKTFLTLEQRVWTCHMCGTDHDRDVNAAINILHEGLRILAVGTTER